MTKRTRKYLAIKVILKKASLLKSCIQYPHFGASYPDACCIDGFLWDLDSNDDSGLLGVGGSDPCPCCNTKSYIHDALEMGSSLNRVKKYMLFIFSRYSIAKN